MRRLVVAEKNNAAIRIATILSGGKAKRYYTNRVPWFRFARDGDEYTVMGLRGHILELDYPDEMKHWRRTNLKDLVWAEPVPKVTAKPFVQSLLEVAKGIDEVTIATDYDREGELIGVEALDIIKQVAPEATVKRARFSALAKRDIEQAFANLAEVDYHLADSAASRQLVDLAWGATLTRFISLASQQKGKDFLSIGRVQSPTLAVLVEREREIEQFVPKPFLTLEATLEKGVEFRAQHERGRFWDAEEAQAALARARAASEAKVLYYDERRKAERPPVPFSTTLFLSEATKLGLSAFQAMQVAEALYHDGYISYPRTDNTTYPPSLGIKTILHKLLESDLKKEAKAILDQERMRVMRGRTSTTDHPPIYPAEAATKKELKGDKWKVYELVVRRFLATLAPDCILDVNEARLDLNGEVFIAEGQRVAELGWRKYYPYFSDPVETTVPPLQEGDAAEVLGVESQEHETKPPPRYTQGGLIQEMERLGLGTKSTRHEIVHKLYERNYVEGKQIRPTLTGRAVVAALAEHAKEITEAEMTAGLERSMEAIATQQKKKDEVVAESQDMLEGVVETLQRNEGQIREGIQAALRSQSQVGPCKAEACGGTLVIRRARRGGRFIGCSNYPECRVTHPLPQWGIVEPTTLICETCAGVMVKHISGGREEIICVNAECPTVIARNRVGACPKCGGDLLMRSGPSGKRFVGCGNYPNCDQTYPLPQRGLVVTTDTKCGACGSPIIRIVSGRRRPWTLCINMGCPSKKAKEEPKGEPMVAKAP